MAHTGSLQLLHDWHTICVQLLCVWCWQVLYRWICCKPLVADYADGVMWRSFTCSGCKELIAVSDGSAQGCP